MAEVVNKEILNRLNQIQIDVSFIRENFADDAIMTVDEEVRHEKTLKEIEERERETTSLEDFKKELEDAGH